MRGGGDAVTGSTSTSPTASWWCWSAPRAAASPRCCAWSRGSKPSPRARSAIGDRVVNKVEPADRDIAMVFQNYALYPHMTVRQNLAYGLKNRRTPQGRDRAAGARGRRDPRDRPFPRPQAPRPFGRPAPARRHGPRHRARARGVPVRRAAVEPRCQAARADAAGDQAAAAAAGHDLDLRDPRPARGDDAGRPARGDERRQDRADRHARWTSTAARPRPSSPASSAARR